MTISRSAVILLLLAALAAGCGSSSATSQPTRAASTSAPQATQAGGAATSAPVGPTAAPIAPTGAGGGSGNGVPTIIDGEYPTGTIHVEVTGDQTATFDATGGGAGVNGAGILNYANATGPVAIGLTLLKDETSGWALTSASLALGGSWGTECELKITRNDGTGLSGEFSCPSVQGGDLVSGKSYRLSVKATFTSAR